MTAVAPDLIPQESFQQLHPVAIDDPQEIRALLERLCREGVRLRKGSNLAAHTETARIAAVGDDVLDLECEHFRDRGNAQLFLNAELDGVPYFFSALPRRGLGEAERAGGPRPMQIAWPAVVYRAERRDRPRRPMGKQAGGAQNQVQLEVRGAALARGHVVDLSADGLGLAAVECLAGAPKGREFDLAELGRRREAIQVAFLDGPRAGERQWTEIRNTAVAKGSGGPRWHRLGLAVLPAARAASVEFEVVPEIEPPPVSERVDPLAAGWMAPEARRITYPSRDGEEIVGLLDAWGDPRDALSVVIPPAWGKTKETLLPLAATIVSSFAAIGQPVAVLRFDGVRRRGESHNDPECREIGRENLHYTFSQGVADIVASFDFLEREGFAPERMLIVSFSISAIEARRALAQDKRRRFAGWIPVVAASDPQSLIRVISGGIDYMGGAEREVPFGNQDVQGLLLDMDRAGRDAVTNRIAFLADGRRDMATLDLPVSWIHGREDAWNDIHRIKDMLSCGDAKGRRLLQVPTGHQLRSSREALGVFALIAAECGRLCLGKAPSPRTPDEAWLRQRRKAERKRLRDPKVDLRGFWRDYLVGRDETLGMELVLETEAYRELMADQLQALSLSPNERVVDLGCGLATLPVELARRGNGPAGLELVEIDYVVAGLRRGRSRAAASGSDARLSFLAADLDVEPDSGRSALPLAEATADAVLASLVLNYLRHPQILLREIIALLKPGGRLVVTCLRRDADTSRICVDGVAELRSGRGLRSFGRDGEKMMDHALGGFIADAGKLIDFEERGVFRFWDACEVETMLVEAGFESIDLRPTFGDPAQAWLARARRPRAGN